MKIKILKKIERYVFGLYMTFVGIFLGQLLNISMSIKQTFALCIFFMIVSIVVSVWVGRKESE